MEVSVAGVLDDRLLIIGAGSESGLMVSEDGIQSSGLWSLTVASSSFRTGPASCAGSVIEDDARGADPIAGE